MGKIRVKALGDEEQEKKQKQDAKARKEAKKVTSVASHPELVDRGIAVEKSEADSGQARMTENTTEAAPTKQSKKKFKSNKKAHSTSFQTVASLVDAKKIYSFSDALDLLPKLKRAKFDETVELHINTKNPGITVSTVLPHGTGKKVRVAIASDAIIAEVAKGSINFDILVAEPSMMPRLAKVAKVLGPRGLMPNPKNGTVTPHPEEVAKKFEGGQVNFKTEAKFPLLHVSVGKVSFGKEKLLENIASLAKALPATNVAETTIKLTMSPGIHVDYTSI